MYKTQLALSLGAVLSTVAPIAHAATVNLGTRLTITAGVQTYDQNGNPADVVKGSWFGFEGNGDYKTQGVEKTPLSQGPDGGLIIGLAQDTNGHASHAGDPHAGAGGIDAEFLFLGNSAMHFTTTPVTGSTSTGSGGGLDFGGWAFAWNSFNHPLGGGAWQPTNCAALGCGGHTFIDGNAMFLWDGTYGGSYTLHYTATSPNGPFAGVPFSVHLEGHVVPLPAAIWLLGSGLIGLVGFARSRA